MVEDIEKLEETRPSVAELEKKAEEKHSSAKKEKPVEKIEKKLEKEFIIPLRRKFKKTARYKRVPKAIRAIKEFLVRHMKVYDRDLRKIKLDKYLNEFIWTRGIRNPPSKVKVRVVVDGEFIRVELAELTEALKFKKQKLEKRETKTRPSVAELKKKEVEKPVEPGKTEEEKTEDETRRRKAMLEKEKKSAVVEAGRELEKATAKQAKHTTKDKTRQPKHQRRMALAK
jgi:large subunit ribosomal protein L31e